MDTESENRILAYETEEADSKYAAKQDVVYNGTVSGPDDWDDDDPGEYPDVPDRPSDPFPFDPDDDEDDEDDDFPFRARYTVR